MNDISMIHRQIRPPSGLARFIRHFWIIEYHSGQATELPFRLMADGFPSLVFQYKNRFRDKECPSTVYPCALLLGHTCHFRNLMIGGDFGIFGVSLLPYTPPLLFPLTASDYANRVIDINELEGLVYHKLAEKIILAGSNSKRIGILTDYLVSKLSTQTHQDALVQEVVQSIIHYSGRRSVKRLMDKMTLSRRQFERRFREEVGLSPKMFSRIIHFQSCLQEQPPEVKSLTGLAFNKGYADQSHFCREFKAFSGINPGFYFKHIEETAETLMHI